MKNRLLQNADVIIGQDDLLENLKNGKKLKIKFGVDPTRPDLTFGHLVVFNKLRQFQDEGHEAILLIGDYTARIGDPSGRSELRPELSEAEVNENASTYLNQAFKILDEEKTTVRRNSEWFGKMSFADALTLTRSMTVARMLERDDFEKRFKSNQPISMVEFMYPLIQGYDSIILDSVPVYDTTALAQASIIRSTVIENSKIYTEWNSVTQTLNPLLQSQVLRSENGEPFQYIATLDSSAHFYIDDNVDVFNSEYEYIIVSRNCCQVNSSNSNYGSSVLLKYQRINDYETILDDLYEKLTINYFIEHNTNYICSR